MPIVWHKLRTVRAYGEALLTLRFGVALVHESESGANFSSAALIGYVMTKDFGLPSSSIRFRRLYAISA
jgi:hypothetical protein